MGEHSLKFSLLAIKIHRAFNIARVKYQHRFPLISSFFRKHSINVKRVKGKKKREREILPSPPKKDKREKRELNRVKAHHFVKKKERKTLQAKRNANNDQVRSISGWLSAYSEQN